MRILALMMLMVVGCGKTAEEKVVGTYEAKKDGNTYKFVLLDNGVFEAYDGVEKEEGKWKIVDRGIHVSNEDGEKDIWIKNKDKSITRIEGIREGKRTVYSKEDKWTFKKIL